MKAILYDCSDHPDARYRSKTLRLFDATGRMVLQGLILTGNGRELAERIAAGLGADFQFVGPPEGKSVASPPPADFPGLAEYIAAEGLTTLDTPAEYDVPKGQLSLF